MGTENCRWSYLTESCDQANEIEDLERIFVNASAEPTRIAYAVIRSITKNFVELIGRGGFGEVYMGALQSGMVAVKKPLQSQEISDKQFLDEVNCLIRVKHQNIVRFLGYCADTQGELMEIDGKYRIVEVPQRIFCFEYAPNGNLHHYLKEKSRGYNWNTHYRIVKGICQGLQYLHQKRIIHLDLKPENVLLGPNMEAKITDFGLSRCFDEEQSRILTKNFGGTFGYIAPEIIENGEISFKADIFSLGIIMKDLLTVSNDNITENEHESLNVDCPQMKICNEIAQICVDRDPHNRPTIDEIICRLNETESMVQKIEPLLYEPITDPESTLYQVVHKFRSLSAQALGGHSRMDGIYMELDILERVLDGSKKPGDLSYPLIQLITDSFSSKRKISQNDFGEYFKCNLRNGIVVVKRIFDRDNIEDEMFYREVRSMLRVQHKNIVQFLGYCSYTGKKIEEATGVPTKMVDVRERLLCFEYLSNGSLENYISDELRGLEWNVRYQIIKGICEGLHYLHKEKCITHMDLKPANILLDDCMVPKITEFGVSRLKEEAGTISTGILASSLGYYDPEYVFDGKISNKADVYSLGVVITELVTGSKEKPNITNVIKRWKHRWNKSGKSLLMWHQQVTKCLELAQSCLQKVSIKRPSIWDIIHELNEFDKKASTSTFDEIRTCSWDMISIEPLELHFPFEFNKEIGCSVVLANDTDHNYAFRISSMGLLPFRTEPTQGIVSPRSKCCIAITFEAQKTLPLRKHHKEKLWVQSTIVDKTLTADDVTRYTFSAHPSKVVDVVDLIAFLEYVF